MWHRSLRTTLDFHHQLWPNAMVGLVFLDSKLSLLRVEALAELRVRLRQVAFKNSSHMYLWATSESLKISDAFLSRPTSELLPIHLQNPIFHHPQLQQLTLKHAECPAFIWTVYLLIICWLIC